MLETHSKTLIIFGGFSLSIFGWFLWNLILSNIYERVPGIYPVRDSLLRNYGRQQV